jgi:hypothetical protein
VLLAGTWFSSAYCLSTRTANSAFSFISLFVFKLILRLLAKR